MIAQVFDYNGQVCPAVLNLPEVPTQCLYPTVDMLEDGIWLSGYDREIEDENKRWLVYQLVGGEWVLVKCEKTLDWFNLKSCGEEVEYKIV